LIGTTPQRPVEPPTEEPRATSRAAFKGLGRHKLRICRAGISIDLFTPVSPNQPPN